MNNSFDKSENIDIFSTVGLEFRGKFSMVVFVINSILGSRLKPTLHTYCVALYTMLKHGASPKLLSKKNSPILSLGLTPDFSLVTNIQTYRNPSLLQQTSQHKIMVN